MLDSVGARSSVASFRVEGDGAGDAFRMFLLDEAAIQARSRGEDVIQITLGISDLQLRGAVLAAITSAACDPVVARRVCPAGLPELREALSHHYLATCGVEVPADRILIDAGTSSIFRNLLQLLTQPGDEVLLPRPYYPLYKFSALLARATCRHYDVDLGTLRIDVASVARGINERTRAIVLNSPGNPLGNVISPADLAEVLAVVPPDTCVIFDEIYDNVHFSNDARPLTPILLADSRRRKRLVVTNSFSKGYRMYTRRVGWCVLPLEIVRPMTVIQHHTRLTVDPSVQLGAVEALKHGEDVDELRATHRSRWEHVRSRLADLDGVRLLPSAGGFYCMLDCRAFMAERKIANCLDLALDVLARAGVAAVPGADFGLPGMLRLSFTSARFQEAVDRLRSYFLSPRGSSSPR